MKKNKLKGIIEDLMLFLIIWYFKIAIPTTYIFYILWIVPKFSLYTPVSKDYDPNTQAITPRCECTVLRGIPEKILKPHHRNFILKFFQQLKKHEGFFYQYHLVDRIFIS